MTDSLTYLTGLPGLPHILTVTGFFQIISPTAKQRRR